MGQLKDFANLDSFRGFLQDSPTPMFHGMKEDVTMNGDVGAVLYTIGRTFGLAGGVSLLYFALNSRLMERQRDRFGSALAAYRSSSQTDKRSDAESDWRRANAAGTTLIENMASQQATLLATAMLLGAGGVFVLFSRQVHWLLAVPFALFSLLNLGMKRVIKKRYEQESRAMGEKFGPGTDDFFERYQWQCVDGWFRIVLQIFLALGLAIPLTVVLLK